MIKSINFDPKHFESPEEFRPERFINSEGKFASPTEAFIPFGIDTGIVFYIGHYMLSSLPLTKRK
ncbi:cytochrome P450 18a1 [Armadillidium vulgare]|nr:cytochrome P450 18a1 [Armadillidium vulgare]